jgi:hypothetical protein
MEVTVPDVTKTSSHYRKVMKSINLVGWITLKTQRAIIFVQNEMRASFSASL